MTVIPRITLRTKYKNRTTVAIDTGLPSILLMAAIPDNPGLINYTAFPVLPILLISYMVDGFKQIPQINPLPERWFHHDTYMVNLPNPNPLNFPAFSDSSTRIQLHRFQTCFANVDHPLPSFKKCSVRRKKRIF